MEGPLRESIDKARLQQIQLFTCPFLLAELYTVLIRPSLLRGLLSRVCVPAR